MRPIKIDENTVGMTDLFRDTPLPIPAPALPAPVPVADSALDNLPFVPAPETNGDLEALATLRRLLREHGPSGEIRAISGPLCALGLVIKGARSKGWNERIDTEKKAFSVTAPAKSGERRVWKRYGDISLLMMVQTATTGGAAEVIPPATVQAVPGGYALRGYQRAAVKDVQHAWEKMASPEMAKKWQEKEAKEKKADPALQKLRRRAVLLQSVTGSGKTVMLVKLIQDHLQDGGRVVVMAHMLELLEQTRAKLIGDGLDPDVIGMVSSIHPEPTNKQRVLISTDKSGKRLLGLLQSKGNILLVIDECHHAMSKQYLDIIKGLNPVKILGASATPTRADGRGLGRLFGTMVSAMTYRDAFDPLPDGSPAALVRPRYFTASTPDLSNVKFNKITREYDSNDVDAIMRTPQIAGDIFRHADLYYPDKKAIVFAPTRRHGRWLLELYIANGYAAAYLDGETPKRRKNGRDAEPGEEMSREEILEKYASGEIMVLINVLVGAEGFDEPSIEVVVNLVPRASEVLWIQTVGRALRPYPGKTEALVIDHTDTLLRLGPVETYDTWTLSEKPGANKQGGGAKKGAAQCAACGVDLVGYRCPKCGGEAERRVDGSSRILSALDCDLVEHKDKQALAVSTVREGGRAALVKAAFGKNKADRQAVVSRAHTAEEKSEMYAQMCQYAVSIGKNTGFGFILYLELYGEKPAWSADPPRAPVSPENLEFFRALAERKRRADGMARGNWRLTKIKPAV